MKKIKHILIAAILTAGGFLAGCTSIADELTELSLTRCLEPLNLEYTISDGDSVVFNWDLVTGSDQFALQIAENSGTFETEDGKLTSSVIHDLVIKADQVPFASVYRPRPRPTTRSPPSGLSTPTPSPPTQSAAASSPR